MARRGSGTATAESVEDSTENTTEVTEEQPTAAPEDTGTEASAEVDLSAFTKAIDEAASESDRSTGTVPENLFGPVTEAFRALPDTKARNRAKALLTDKMREAMDAMDAPRAKAYMTLQDKATASSPAQRAPREPADPTQAYIEKVVALTLARNLVPQPEGLAADWQDRARSLSSQAEGQTEAFRAYLDSEDDNKTEPEGTLSVVRAAFKLASARTGGAATSRSTGVRSGVIHNVGNHIIEAFADKPVGTFMKISEIRAFRSKEYGDEAPSAGALSVRLFPANGKDINLPGIEASTSDDGKGNRGARKVS